MHIYCAYRDQRVHGAGPQGDGCITGHHIIPDHCFYYTFGAGKKSCPVVAGYKTGNAPVVLVTANRNGGKSREHGQVHAVFDPIELKAQRNGSNQWTYREARDAAIKSLKDALGADEEVVREKLDEYFMYELGLTEDNLIKAGDHGVMASAPDPRRNAKRRAAYTSSKKSRSSGPIDYGS
ncbi:hypothetical protein [Aliiruegeria sabulilitoris]|uniref:hypothetical protein n=1 Tax=Aliiruegeria sabulilitoris TaxID=1510458 RepID=UPI0012E3EB69|nr:hypothetical protein [Aliiruegeria sabulilitoris]NDR57389.1 hypothetical protein [Pseudoruegeria sp. M32A2M]